MSNLEPQTVEQFVESFLDYSSDKSNKTNREVLPTRSNKISKKNLAREVKNFLTHKGEALDAPYNPFDSTNKLTPAFINEFQKQLGMNVIRRNPGKTSVAGIATVVGAFAIPSIVFFTIAAVTGVTAISAVLPFLPFLAALGPVGAVLAFAGLIAAAALVIYGVTVGITAAATTPKKTEIEEDDEQHVSIYASLNTHAEMSIHHDLEDTTVQIRKILKQTEAEEQARRNQPQASVAAPKPQLLHKDQKGVEDTNSFIRKMMLETEAKDQAKKNQRAAAAATLRDTSTIYR
jgi:hypothetical protein